MSIYLIRHGETDWNLQLRLQGREDIPLNETGVDQAKRTGFVFQDIPIDAIVTSPLQRARITGEIIGKEIGVTNVIIENDIIEKDFGEASGLTYVQKHEKYKDVKCKGEEDLKHIQQRMLHAIMKYSKLYENVIMVSHGASIKAAILAISHGTYGTSKEILKNCCINVIEVIDGQLNLECFNLAPEEFKALLKK